MAFSQFGTNSVARKQHVYYEGTSTIYEGMPVCYNYNTTTNILGYSKSSAAKGTTTTEGYQNEGKLLRVENPAADNLLWFAGVVATSDYAGKTGPCWLDIYIPNGTIVPVRVDLNCTVGRTILALESASQALTDPLSATQGRPVAVAEETIDRSSTAGLCLAKLDPNLFVYQDNTGDALLVGKATTVTGDMVVNHIDVTSYNTGRFSAFEIISRAAANFNGTGYGHTLYCETHLDAAITDNQIAGVAFWTNIDTAVSHTFAQYMGLEIGIYESSANLSSVSQCLSPLCLRMQLDGTNGAGANKVWMMNLIADGAKEYPDGLFSCYNAGSVNMTAKTSAAVTHIIPVQMRGNMSGGPASGIYYIMVSDTA